MKYELPDHVIQYLEMFLNRVELKGSEVPMFIEVINALRNPVVEVNEAEK